jgi:hypothetical protein
LQITSASLPCSDALAAYNLRRLRIADRGLTGLRRPSLVAGTGIAGVAQW